MPEKPKQLTVGKLKELLSQYSDEVLVYTAGCDCTGVADGIEFDRQDGEDSILITRMN